MAEFTYLKFPIYHGYVDGIT